MDPQTADLILEILKELGEGVERREKVLMEGIRLDREQRRRELAGYGVDTPKEDLNLAVQDNERKLRRGSAQYDVDSSTPERRHFEGRFPEMEEPVRQYKPEDVVARPKEVSALRADLDQEEKADLKQSLQDHRDLIESLRQQLEQEKERNRPLSLTIREDYEREYEKEKEAQDVKERDRQAKEAAEARERELRRSIDKDREVYAAQERELVRRFAQEKEQMWREFEEEKRATEALHRQKREKREEREQRETAELLRQFEEERRAADVKREALLQQLDDKKQQEEEHEKKVKRLKEERAKKLLAAQSQPATKNQPAATSLSEEDFLLVVKGQEDKRRLGDLDKEQVRRRLAEHVNISTPEAEARRTEEKLRWDTAAECHDKVAATWSQQERKELRQPLSADVSGDSYSLVIQGELVDPESSDTDILVNITQDVVIHVGNPNTSSSLEGSDTLFVPPTLRSDIALLESTSGLGYQVVSDLVNEVSHQLENSHEHVKLNAHRSVCGEVSSDEDGEFYECQTIEETAEKSTCAYEAVHSDSDLGLQVTGTCGVNMSTECRRQLLREEQRQQLFSAEETVHQRHQSKQYSLKPSLDMQSLHVTEVGEAQAKDRHFGQEFRSLQLPFENDARPHKEALLEESKQLEAVRKQIRQLCKYKETAQVPSDEPDARSSSMQKLIDSLEDKAKDLSIQLADAREGSAKQRTTTVHRKMLDEQTNCTPEDAYLQGSCKDAEPESSGDQPKGTEDEVTHVVPYPVEFGGLQAMVSVNNPDKEVLQMRIGEKAETLVTFEEELPFKEKMFTDLMHNGQDMDSAQNRSIDSCSSNARDDCSLQGQSDTVSEDLSDIGRIQDVALKENRRLQEDLATMTKENQNLKMELSETVGEREQLRAQVQSYIHEVRRTEYLLSSIEQERINQVKQCECLKLEVEQHKTKSHQFEADSSNLRLEVMAKDKEICHLREQTDRLEREIQEYTTAEHAYEMQISDLAKYVSYLENTVRTAERDKQQLMIDLSTIRGLYAKLEATEESVRKELTDNSLENEELQSIVEDMKHEKHMICSQAPTEGTSTPSQEDTLQSDREQEFCTEFEIQESNAEIQLLKDRLVQNETKIDSQANFISKLLLEIFQQQRQLMKMTAEMQELCKEEEEKGMEMLVPKLSGRIDTLNSLVQQTSAQLLELSSESTVTGDGDDMEEANPGQPWHSKKHQDIINDGSNYSNGSVGASQSVPRLCASNNSTMKSENYLHLLRSHLGRPPEQTMCNVQSVGLQKSNHEHSDLGQGLVNHRMFRDIYLALHCWFGH